jgi:hypothetical protein
MSSTSGPRYAVDPAGKCRSCGSRLRPEATWCSLCHTAVDDASSLAAGFLDAGFLDAESGLTPAAARPAVAIPAVPVHAAATPAVPMQADPERRPIDPAVEAVAERLLAELAQDVSRNDQQTWLTGLLPRFERLTGLSGPGGRLVLTMAGGVLLLAGLILGLTLLGLLL